MQFIDLKISKTFLVKTWIKIQLKFGMIYYLFLIYIREWDK